MTMNELLQRTEPEDEIDLENGEIETEIPGESKRARFERIGKLRMEIALKRIRLLGNLSDRYHYDWSEADVRKMHLRLVAALDEMLARFKDSKPDDTFDF